MLQVLGLFLLWLCEVKYIWRCCKILHAFWIALPVGFWRRHQSPILQSSGLFVDSFTKRLLNFQRESSMTSWLSGMRISVVRSHLSWSLLSSHAGRFIFNPSFEVSGLCKIIYICKSQFAPCVRWVRNVSCSRHWNVLC